MNNAILAVALGWLIPGAGHLMLGRKWQAGLLFVATILLLIVGLNGRGIYYPGNPADFGMMYWLHQVSGLGNGAFLILNLLFKQDLNSAAAQTAFSSATFEYAGRCLALAGLLNYLALLDVSDIMAKRK